MALPKTIQPSLTPDELTFLAEEELIDIVPLFSMTKVRLLSVSPGPLVQWVELSCTFRPLGDLRPLSTALCVICPALARSVSQTKTEMSDSRS